LYEEVFIVVPKMGIEATVDRTVLSFGIEVLMMDKHVLAKGDA
jgi:hypothetical protein